MKQHQEPTEGQWTMQDLEALVKMVTEGPNSRIFHANAKSYFPDCTDSVTELSPEHKGHKGFEYLRGALVDEEKVQRAEAIKASFAWDRMRHLGF
jgi:hypothetical protein